MMLMVRVRMSGVPERLTGPVATLLTVKQKAV